MNIEELVSKSGHTIVKYYADWCGPCKMMNPVMDKLAENPDITVIPVNIDNEHELTQQSGITSVPTLGFYTNGEYMGKSIGAMSEGMIMNAINGKLTLTK